MHKHTEPAITASEMRPAKAPTSTTWAQKLALIGPAFIAGAWQFGPGNLTSAVEAGSAYGYALVWVIAVSTLLMIFFTDMSVRIGIAAPGTMIATIKSTLGKPWGVVAGLSVFFITLCFSVGNAAGSGLALSMLFGGSALLWTAVCTIGVAFVLLMRNIYTAVERILLVLVAMMAVGFIASAFLAGPDWGAGVGGMVPSFPPGAELLIIALVGTNFSINAAFFTSYATRERGIRADQYRDATITDTIPGIVAPGIMTCLVIMVAAAVLGHTGEKVTTLVQLANVFEPLAGKVGSTIFVVGFFGAAFSSMLANATAGGTLLADGLGAERRVQRGALEAPRRLRPRLRPLRGRRGPGLPRPADHLRPGDDGPRRAVPRRDAPRHRQQPADGRPAQSLVAEPLRRHRLPGDPR